MRVNIELMRTMRVQSSTWRVVEMQSVKEVAATQICEIELNYKIKQPAALADSSAQYDRFDNRCLCQLQHVSCMVLEVVVLTAI